MEKILQKITRENAIFTDQDFIQLYDHQLKNNTAYSNYCNQYNISKHSISNVEDIPSIPTDSYKSDTNPCAFSLTEYEVTTFKTSGTTADVKGSHHFRSTQLYERSIIRGWESLGIPKLSSKTLFLTPSAEEAPHSSLSHMMDTLKTSFCPSATFIFSDGVLDLEMFHKVANSEEPITLIGTALAFLMLFEALEESGNTLTLPPGSWAMETGGYKGTGKSLTKEQLYQLFHQYLGLEEKDIWNEYSMTELSSQFYTNGIGKPHRGPDWTRVKVINPETMQSVKPGEMGYLVIYDLANYDSCMAIMTQDLAIYHDEQSFTLIGRDPSALPRGCSRSL